MYTKPTPSAMLVSYINTCDNKLTGTHTSGFQLLQVAYSLLIHLIYDILTVYKLYQ